MEYIYVSQKNIKDDAKYTEIEVAKLIDKDIDEVINAIGKACDIIKEAIAQLPADENEKLDDLSTIQLSVMEKQQARLEAVRDYEKNKCSEMIKNDDYAKLVSEMLQLKRFEFAKFCMESTTQVIEQFKLMKLSPVVLAKQLNSMLSAYRNDIALWEARKEFNALHMIERITEKKTDIYTID